MDGPTHIGEWQKISELGSGTFGVVTLWRKVATGEYIAIKKCKFHMGSHLSDKQKERWNNEVQIMKIINHPNIIKYKPIPSELEMGLMKQNPTKLPLLPMEYCVKGNLRRLLCKPKNLSGLQEDDVRCILEDISNGLQHLHKLKITHRDIKPDNIVLQQCDDRKSGTIYKIIDLGYAKELTDTVVSFVGTLHYLAPEIFENVQYNTSVDYWSMGILTFEVICGVLPFLPHLAPVERFEKIQKKGPDDICIYRSYSGQITYSSELKRENFISSCLKQDIEVWLRHVLQYDSKRRSENFANNVQVFEYMNKILAKHMINVFSVHKLEFYSYEINESTLLSTLKDWISRDTKVCKKDLILLFENNVCDVNDSSLAFNMVKNSDTVFAIKKGGDLINEKATFNFPKLLKEIFKPSFDNSYIKQLYAQTVYYVTIERSLIQAFIKSFSLYVLYLRNMYEQLKKAEMDTSTILSRLLRKIECYNGIRKNNVCDVDFRTNDDYQQCLNYSQRLLCSLERSITSFKDLQRKIGFLLKKQETVNENVIQMKTILEACNIEELYNKTLNLLEKNSYTKQSNGKPFCLKSEIKSIVSETIKVKDKLIHSKVVKGHLSTITKVHASVENLNSWLLHYNTHLVELSESFEQCEIIHRNIMVNSPKANLKKKLTPSPSFDGELQNLPSEYLIQENKELRSKFDDILSKSILEHNNYVASVKSCF